MDGRSRRGTNAGRRWAIVGTFPLIAVAVIAAIVLIVHEQGLALAGPEKPELHPQTTWVACNRNAHSKAPSTFKPLSDRAAAALVTPQAETRADNDKPFTVDGVRHAAPNVYVPTNAQLAAFRASKTSFGQTAVQFNPYLADVDGRDGMKDPTTDDLIQWVAHKWGIPENWLRAEYVVESNWSMWQLGDESAQPANLYDKYPAQARVPGTLDAYESLGITQVRWDPNGDVGVGAEPLRWESEAFNMDYQGAMVRFYYDNPEETRTVWGDSTYVPCQKWNSIGAWDDSFPWGNADQAQYIAMVQKDLAGTAWRTNDFLSWSPPSLPSGVTLR